MSNPAQPASRITPNGQDLMIGLTLALRRSSMHHLTTTPAELVDADHTERACHGERNLALAIMLSCAMDEAAEGEVRAAWEFLRAAVVTARRIDAARSEGLIGS